jgi:hypothetical protein
MHSASAIHTAITRLTHLGDQFTQLRRMLDIEESAPHLVEELHAHTLTVIGYQVYALEAAHLAVEFAERHNDFDSNRRALTTCTQAFQDCCSSFYENLFTVSRIDDLVELMSKEAENSWAKITIQDLTACHLSLQAATFALMEGWQEFAIRAAANSISIQPTNVSQQFLFPAQNQP